VRVTPTLAWQLDSARHEALDPRLLPLLEAISATESLSAAIGRCGVSYRAAWGMLRDYHRKLNAPLVHMQRGRGARLAPAGARLLDAHRSAQMRLARILPSLCVDVGETALPVRAGAPRLRIAASHDLALGALRDAQAVPGLELDLSFMGSLDALRLFDEGRVDAAGFHVAVDVDDRQLAPFLRCLRPSRDRLIPFVLREQGLILPRGNPERVRSFRDVARKGLRFVNRQQGSGTRLLVERMLAEQQVAPQSLLGYASEEFTHPAVAATVASGAAEVGFGLRAAAAELRLAFVPCIRERYYIAVRAAAIPTPAVARLIEVLESPLFARVVRQLPGYRRDTSAAIVRIDALSP
jgi:putative molybdopterin biosynthesis protein